MTDTSPLATWTTPDQLPPVYVPSTPPTPVETPSLIQTRTGHVIRPDETVNHPLHYNDHPSGIETIEVIEHMSFNIGNAMKYMWRAGLKPSAEHVEDLKKAMWYVQREIDRVTATT